MIAAGIHVKLLLNNNHLIEGIVEHWDTKQVKLKSLDSESILIVHHPERDIILTKIVAQEVKSKKELANITFNKKILQPSGSINEVSAQNNEFLPPINENENDIFVENEDNVFTEIDDNLNEENINLQKLTNLRKEFLKAEKKEIMHRLRDHTLNNIKPTTYELPKFIRPISSK